MPQFFPPNSPSPTDLFNNAYLNDGTNPGRGLSALGGPMFVVNKNSQALNVAVANGVGSPWHLIRGDNTQGFAPNHANCVPFIVPEFGMYLNLYHVWRSNLDQDAPPRIQVFGLLPPIPSNNALAKNYPEHWDADFPAFDNDTYEREFWVQLEDPDEVDPYLEFDSDTACRFGVSMGISKKRTVYLQGCKRCVVAVTQGATFELQSGESVTSSSSGSDATYGMITAQISG